MLSVSWAVVRSGVLGVLLIKASVPMMVGGHHATRRHGLALQAVDVGQCPCVFFRLLLICDDESAWPLLGAALVAAIRSCCLLARGARRPCRVVQRSSRVFPTAGR